jgi:hypothetical protein
LTRRGAKKLIQHTHLLLAILLAGDITCVDGKNLVIAADFAF